MLSDKKLLINADDVSQKHCIDLIANKLNQLLNENNISTKVLSQATDISVAAINNLKRGEGNPTIGTLTAISRFFGVSLIEILGLTNLNPVQTPTMIVHLYDLRFADQQKAEHILKKMLIETPSNTDLNTIFGVVMSNNCLLPIYEKGTIFILANNSVVSDGDIVLVRIRNQINSLKRIFMKQNDIYLKNISIDDSIEKYEKDEIRILGTAIQIIQKQYE
jgi:transcriptional regulator with XRE-family HTH domain